MNDDIETVVDPTIAGEAMSEARSTPNVEPDESVPESADQDRNPDGTYKARDAEEPDEASDEATTDDGESDESGEQDEQPERRERNRNARQRIGELTAQRNEARVRAEMAERHLQQLQQQYAPVDPNLEFEDPAQFTQQSINQAMDERAARETAQAREAARIESARAAQEMFMARVEEARADMPDFDQVFNDSLPITEVGVDFLSESELGPQVAYHLGKNPNVARRIANMSPAKQGVELARIEAKLSAPPAKRTTKAPKPPRTISGGSSPTSVAPEKMDNEAYRKWRMGTQGA